MPAIRDFAFNYTTSTVGTTITVPMPSYEAGDLLLAYLTADDSAGGTRIFTASGWTQLLRVNSAGLTSLYISILYKIASASESDTIFTSSSQETFNGTIVSIRDVDTFTPFNFSEIAYDILNGHSLGLVTLRPNASGLYSEWTGTYADVDEEVADDATTKIYKYFGVGITYRQMFNLPSASLVSPIKQIKVTARATGTTPFNIGISDGSTANWSSPISITGAFANYSNIWTTNPFTASAWVPSDIDSLQIGVQASVAAEDGIDVTQIYIEISTGGIELYLGTKIGVSQSFVGDGNVIHKGVFNLRKYGAPTGNITAKIYAHSGTYGTSSIPTGAALATSTTVDITTLATTNALYNFYFTVANGITLTNGTNYTISLEYSGGDASNYLVVDHDESSPSHGGNLATLTGATWTEDSGKDAIFYVHTGAYNTTYGTAIKSNLPTMTTTRNDCLLFYLVTHSTLAVPSIIEGPAILLAAKDGTAFSDGLSWGMQRIAGTTPSNVGLSSIAAVANWLTMVLAINPPSTGATVIPTHCTSDLSTYLTPINGTTVYNGDTAMANTYTTYFGTVLNTRTVGNGTVTARTDSGLNPYHSVADLSGSNTSGQYLGCTNVFATANKPNVSGKNIIVHTRPYLPVDIQTTDSVTLTGAMGAAFGLCSTANTDYKMWHVSGANTSWGVEMRPIVINTSNTSGLIQNTGTLNAASILALGFALSGKNATPNWVWGSAWVLDTCTVAGGTSIEPLNIDGIVMAAATGHERMSVTQQGSKQMMLFGPLQIGDGGTNPVYMDLDATAIEFPEIYNKASKTVNYCSVDNVAGLTYYAGASDTIKHRNSVVSSASKYHWKFDANTATSATYDFKGLQVIGAGTVQLKSGILLEEVSFSSCDAIPVSGASLNSCSFSSTTGINALTLATSGESTNITNCAFIGTGTTSHAMKLDGAGTYSSTGHTFTGYGPTVFGFHTTNDVNATTDVVTKTTHTYSTGAAITYNKQGGSVNIGLTDNTTYYVRAVTADTLGFYTSAANAIADTSRIALTSTGSETHYINSNSAAVFNNSGGAIIINISSGDVPTIRNGTSATTTIVASANFVVTGLISGSEVHIYRTSDLVALYDNESTGTSLTWEYNADNTNVYMTFLKPGYKWIRLDNLVLSSAGVEILLQPLTDPGYNNPV